MENLDWYYIYSPRYYSFDLYLKDSMPKGFINRGIFIDQSVFDEHLYKHQGEHFFSRITIKVETLCKILREKYQSGDTRPFIFSDVDILIKPAASTDLQSYIQKVGFDMIFQQEHIQGPTVNPGFILIWPTEASCKFWEQVYEEMKQPGKMEMGVINEILAAQSTNIRCDRFLLDHVCSPITINENNLKTMSIYHLLSGTNDRIQDMTEKTTQANLLGTNIEEYHKKVIEKYGMIVN